jgi:hypothetical protein
MVKKKDSNINIKNVKGNIVISQNQQGGITTYDYNSSDEILDFNQS